MTIEIVGFPIKNGGSFHSYVKLPEGNRKNQCLCELSDFPFFRKVKLSNRHEELRTFGGHDYLRDDQLPQDQ
jgi:hypothetical protein